MEIPLASDSALQAVDTAELTTELTRVVMAQITPNPAPTKGAKGAKGATAGVAMRKGKGGATLGVIGVAAHREVAKRVALALEEYLGRRRRVFFVSDGQHRVIISKVIAQVPDAVEARQGAFTEAHLDALVDVYLPSDPLAEPKAEIERDNAVAQARFIETVPCYSAQELAELAGHGATNQSATATRWKTTQRAIFGVRRLGKDRYPAFQFQDGRPRKIIGKVLKALPAGMSPWQTALWFSSPNGWLDGDTPMNRLTDEAALLAAALHEGDDWAG
jgi:hypothetical protein